MTASSKAVTQVGFGSAFKVALKSSRPNTSPLRPSSRGSNPGLDTQASHRSTSHDIDILRLDKSGQQDEDTISQLPGGITSAGQSQVADMRRR